MNEGNNHACVHLLPVSKGMYIMIHQEIVTDWKDNATNKIIKSSVYNNHVTSQGTFFYQAYELQSHKNNWCILYPLIYTTRVRSLSIFIYLYITVFCNRKILSLKTCFWLQIIFVTTPFCGCQTFEVALCNCSAVAKFASAL